MSQRSESETDDDSALLPHFPGAVSWVERLLTIIAGVILFVTMTMTTIDVIGRYLFDRPLGFAYEVTALLMATVVFIALPSVTLHREHIAIGLIDSVWHGRVAASRNLVIALVIAACMLFLCYRMYLFVGRFHSYGDRTDVLKLPLYPVAAVGGLGIGLAAFAALILAYHAARQLMRPDR